MARYSSDNSGFRSVFRAYNSGHHQPAEIQEHTDFFKAMLGRDAAHVRLENFYGVNQRAFAAEALTSFQSTSRQLPTQNVVDQAYGLGLAREFDTAVTTKAMKVNSPLPIAYNISVESSLDPRFWSALQPHMSREPSIFEILEHNVPAGADIGHLRDLREQGHRFALDDFNLGSTHEARLALYAPVTDIIKIDGGLVRDCLDERNGRTEQDLALLATRLKSDMRPYNPSVIILAEHVQNFTEANKLFDMGFGAVQGHKLDAYGPHPQFATHEM